MIFRNNMVRFMAIIFLAAASLWVVWPQVPSNYLPSFIPWPERGWLEVSFRNNVFVRRGMTLGLDLQGGTHLVLEADLSQRPPGGTEEDALEGVRRIVERRINAYGVSEPVIQTQGANRISVQLPGVKDIDEAKRLIGRTAQLDFREIDQLKMAELQAAQTAGTQLTPKMLTGIWKKALAEGLDNEPKVLTGAYVIPSTQVVFNPQTNQPEVAFSFNPEGAKMFEQITRRLIGKQLGIFLDDQAISAPTVQSVISSEGRITGVALEDARLLSIQMNAGALPVPVTVIKEQTVDATLGADSIRRSIVAGEIGLGIVMLFMLFNYRLPGLMAGFALLVYTLVTLAIFKLIPVTLTLAGIAAFILSMGMAVDANILIFERMREELRRGRTLGAAIEEGFSRAWPSIRDSNVATLITCGILYWFGSNFGASLVMGFALTLALGVLVSMFSAITVTRTLLRIFIGTAAARRPGLFGME